MRTALLTTLLLGALAAPATAAPKPDARQFPFQEVQTDGLEGDRAILRDEEVYGAPCFFEPKALHDTTVFAILVEIEDAKQTAYVGGVDTALAPLDLTPLRDEGGPVLDVEGARISCVHIPSSRRYGAVVLPYTIEGKGRTRYAVVRITLRGEHAPEAVIVGTYPGRRHAVRQAAGAIPRFDNRLPAGWKSFLVEGGREFCLAEDCPE
ncbi:MAG: hypothetical protein ACQEXJ_09280 [Myxococcota bacterium]